MSAKKKITVAILEALHHRPEGYDLEAADLQHHLSLAVYPTPEIYEVSQALASLKASNYIVSYYDEFDTEYLRITASGRALIASRTK